MVCTLGLGVPSCVICILSNLLLKLCAQFGVSENHRTRMVKYEIKKGTKKKVTRKNGLVLCIKI